MTRLFHFERWRLDYLIAAPGSIPWGHVLLVAPECFYYKNIPDSVRSIESSYCRFFIYFLSILTSTLVVLHLLLIHFSFPGQFFGSLIGLLQAISSLVGLLQYPLFIASQHFNYDSLGVSISLCLCVKINIGFLFILNMRGWF